MKGFQKKYLRGLAHDLDPVVLVGKKGLSDTLIQSVEEQLNIQELIKIKFLDFKEKEQKQAIIVAITEKTGCDIAGMIGNVAILYRAHRNSEKRKIKLPREQG